MSEFLSDIPVVGWVTLGYILAVLCFLLILRKCGRGEWW
jgi:hypothetical protein